MRTYWIVILSLVLSACASTDQKPASPTSTPEPSIEMHLENFGPAPELTNQVWLNTDHPLRLGELRGKVVLLEMWTFG